MSRAPHRTLSRFLSTATAGMASLQSVSATRLHGEVGVSLLPHPAKANAGGEDAYFILEGVSHCLGGGVFDGVGGWASHGIDSGRFSRELAVQASTLLADQSVVTAREMEAALSGSLQGISTPGSCTACLLCVDCEQAELTVLNLGDSGFRLFRPVAHPSSPAFELIARSRSQQHYFNCPFQLGTGSADRPRDADRYREAVRPGDIVVLATDGVFDNMFDDEIAQVLCEEPSAMTLTEVGSTDADAREDARVADGVSTGASAASLAERIARKARALSLDEQRRSPFAIDALAAGHTISGGKLDDGMS